MLFEDVLAMSRSNIHVTLGDRMITINSREKQFLSTTNREIDCSQD